LIFLSPDPSKPSYFLLIDLVSAHEYKVPLHQLFPFFLYIWLLQRAVFAKDSFIFQYTADASTAARFSIVSQKGFRFSLNMVFI
jgi:hypothetical protein